MSLKISGDEKKIISVIKTGAKVQIGLPKLCNYDDDDEEDERDDEVKPPTLRNLNPPPKPAEKAVVEKPRSGLLGLLPPPKSAQFMKKTLPTPTSLKQQTHGSISTHVVTSKSAAIAAEDDDEDEEDEDEAAVGSTSKNDRASTSGAGSGGGSSSNSFLLPRHLMANKFPVKIADQDSEVTISKPPQPRSAATSVGKIQQPIVKEDSPPKRMPPMLADPDEDPPIDGDDDYNDDDDGDEEEEECDHDHDHSHHQHQQPDQPQVLDKEAMLRLIGAQGKKRKLDSDIAFTDVSAKAIVGDNQAELLKQVTSEYKPPSNKEYFTTSSRRTHHVTYLAKVALERDQELRASWAQNKFNRNAAKKKYGF